MTSPTAASKSMDTKRDYFLRAAIAAGVACAAWYLVIRPLEESLTQARGTLADCSNRLAIHQASMAAEPDLDALDRELSLKARTLSEYSSKWGDSGSLYESFRVLARRTNVRLERVEPRGVSPIPGTQRNARSAGDVMNYSLELSGSYEEIAAFLAECNTSLGASKVTSFRLAPLNRRASSGDALLSAAVDTMHIRLEVPDRPSEAAPAPKRKTRQ